MLEECVKDNYGARLHTLSYHCCREMHFISRLDETFSRLNIKFYSQWSVKRRSRASGHGACLKSLSWIITVQGFILPAITAAEICTLFLDST